MDFGHMIGRVFAKPHPHIEVNPMMLQQFANKNDGRWVDINSRKPKRSITQNRYYWLYLGIIAAETGDDAECMHEVFKRQFLSPVFVKVRGKEYKIPRSTTALSKAEFTDYLDKICSLTGIPLPDPQAIGYLPN